MIYIEGGEEEEVRLTKVAEWRRMDEYVQN